MAGESFFVRGDYPENEDLKKRFLSGFHGEDFDPSPIFGDDDFGFRGPSGIFLFLSIFQLEKHSFLSAESDLGTSLSFSLTGFI